MTVGAVWCDRCGGALDAAGSSGGHDACRRARVLEPPRYCPACRRRLKVQVLPAGWRAVCVEHGASGPAAG
ncbi:MAG TPA: hypothetical protein VFM55_08325 [Micromonosporaceae bacterium]|nr:hypothetical protein [Micromonosporaceae bacterium]